MLFICVYAKAFLLWLIKFWERSFKKKKEETEKLGKTRWNRTPEYEIEKMKLDKSKISSYSPVVFKHGCSLEIYLELWRKKKSNIWAFVFFKKFQDNSDMHLDFKKWLQVFLLNYSSGDLEFYYFSVDQSWYNGIMFNGSMVT